MTTLKRRVVIASGVLATLAGVLAVNAVAVSRGDAGAAAEALPLPGGSVFVRQDGPRDAPALVLIHGLGGSTRWWDEVVPPLARSHRVVRIDLLGFGRSAKPSGGGYAIGEQGERVGAALTRIGVRRATVVGHSTGGAVATALAERRPELVSALVLIDSGPRLDAFISDGFVGNLLFVPGVGQLLWRFRTDGVVRRSLGTAFSRPEYEIPRALVDDVRATTYHSLTATSREAERYLAERPLPDRLAPIGKPLLVVFGRDDRRWRASSAADYRAVPGATIELMPGIGHSPMLEDPSRTAASLLDFAASHPA
ncbi:alpha/beta fold hydrolase [Actinomadura chibensis]|uniref:Alpha/beta fold hydrolase n=1 Tax=Actinomadura chibensis TaxID=392828 RepID=A0A5D0NMG3_9ACTN|nr:alpha/beta fold hydrolase [Actinomadura chibensis]TYB45314.1 alpha/beta fold hydrolase [Actinomadura chibensis]